MGIRGVAAMSRWVLVVVAASLAAVAAAVVARVAEWRWGRSLLGPTAVGMSVLVVLGPVAWHPWRPGVPYSIGVADTGGCRGWWRRGRGRVGDRALAYGRQGDGAVYTRVVVEG